MLRSAALLLVLVALVVLVAAAPAGEAARADETAQPASGAAAAPTAPAAPAAPAEVGGALAGIRGSASVERLGDVVRARAVGLPDERFRRVEARVESARSMASARAREALRRFVLDRIPGTALGPEAFAALESTLARETRVVSTTLRVDGAAVVELELAVATVERAIARELPR